MTDVGIIGGGQLARMMIYRSAHLGLSFSVLDPDGNCSSRNLSSVFIQGGLKDPVALRELAAQCRVLSYDIEHIGVETLLELEKEGTTIRPSPRLLATVQDKFLQKELFAKAGVPQPHYYASDPGHRPAVQKKRHGGYDGRGVKIHFHHGEDGLEGETYWEEMVETVRELAVITVTDVEGNVVFYPPVEMIFDPDLNICDQVLLPARISPKIHDEALRVADMAACTLSPLGLVGVLAVELFETPDGHVLLNEVAPRPHNSGHITMETSFPCQFEAHIRAVTGMKVPRPKTMCSGWMKNLLGHGEGVPFLEGAALLDDPSIRLHVYSKPLCRTGRKMGHVSVVADNTEKSLAYADKISNLRIVGK